MAPSKLSESDKRDILDLYRQVGETTSTLASRFGVSNTTISRLLKSSLSEEEYEALIQQKRFARSTSVDDDDAASPTESEQLELTPQFEADDDEQPNDDQPVEVQAEAIEVAPARKIAPPVLVGRRSRRRSRSEVEEEDDLVAPQPNLDLEPAIAEPLPAVSSSANDYGAEATAVEEILGEDLLDQDGELLDLDEEDLGDDDLEDDLDDDLDEDLDDDLDDGAFAEGEEGTVLPPVIRSTAFIKVLPLAEAFIPRTCYLVVDRTAELVARPLREFADLGQIPVEEIQERTLPVFDNHRVAKRFSNRAQRVIKVPDGRVLQKTTSHLQAKGITRLLIDGQVYALN
jgi:transposase-like protein